MATGAAVNVRRSIMNRLTIPECRNLMGSAAADLDDHQVKSLRDSLYCLGEVCIEICLANWPKSERLAA